MSNIVPRTDIGRNLKVSPCFILRITGNSEEKAALHLARNFLFLTSFSLTVDRQYWITFRGTNSNETCTCAHPGNIKEFLQPMLPHRDNHAAVTAFASQIEEPKPLCLKSLGQRARTFVKYSHQTFWALFKQLGNCPRLHTSYSKFRFFFPRNKPQECKVTRVKFPPRRGWEL